MTSQFTFPLHSVMVRSIVVVTLLVPRNPAARRSNSVDQLTTPADRIGKPVLLAQVNLHVGCTPSLPFSHVLSYFQSHLHRSSTAIALFPVICISCSSLQPTCTNRDLPLSCSYFGVHVSPRSHDIQKSRSNSSSASCSSEECCILTSPPPAVSELGKPFPILAVLLAAGLNF